MEQLQVGVRVAVAVVVGLWNGIPHMTQLLLALMALDVVLGMAIAVRDKGFSVSLARDGAARKVGVVGMVVLAALLNVYVQPVIGINLVQAASAFYVLPELASVTKNAASLGAPQFPQLQGVLGYFEGISGGSGSRGG